MSIEIDVLNGGESWPMAKPLFNAVWPPEVVEKLPWASIVFAHAEEAGDDDSLLGAEDNRDFADSVQRMQPYVGWDKLPIVRDAQGRYQFLTFGGRVLNNVIARWAGLASYEVDDIVLRTDQQIDFSLLPTDPRELSGIAALALQIPEELTIFQNILPLTSLVRELRDVWLKAPVYRRSLERLNRARVSVVTLADVAPLCL